MFFIEIILIIIISGRNRRKREPVAKRHQMVTGSLALLNCFFYCFLYSYYAAQLLFFLVVNFLPGSSSVMWHVRGLQEEFEVDKGLKSLHGLWLSYLCWWTSSSWVMAKFAIAQIHIKNLKKYSNLKIVYIKWVFRSLKHKESIRIILEALQILHIKNALQRWYCWRWGGG